MSILSMCKEQAVELDWLDVPFEEKDLAKAAGAKWAWVEKRWYAPEPCMTELERWRAKPPVPNVLAGEDRNFGSGLFVDLVPRTAWFTNVRSCVSKLDWKRIHDMVVSRAGTRCEVCGSERDAERSIWMEAHERWEFDDSTRVQRLRRLICLCTPCHTATHMGLAQVRGVADEALAHLIRTNGWSKAQADAHVSQAFRTWEMRSQVEWCLNLSVLEGAGIPVLTTPDATERRIQADQQTMEIRVEEQSG